MNEKLCQIPAGTSVLVTGATGFTGIELTKKLLDAGLKVSALARNSSNLSPLDGLDIQWFRGDVFDESAIEKAVKGQEYVFHVAAAFRDAESSKKDYWNVHVKSTQLIVGEVLKNPNFKRYVHVSTVGVHGHIANPPANEEYPCSPGDDYQKTKLEAEQWLNESAAEKGLSYTIIRPAAIYGPGDRRLLKLFKMALKPYFLLPGKGRCMYHLVHVDDLTNTFIVAATHPGARGETFISGSSESIAIVDIGRTVAEHFNKKFKVMRLPIGPLFLAGDICEAICKPFKIAPPIYRRRVAFFSKDRSFDVTKMRDVLGYSPRYNNRDGIIQTADWYAEKGWLKP
ncbi:MAG: NAD-dependent epimerase/dehydratase family protein [Deltaproteobacteria bacterium]|nr:NAD-dependent epimerase/dehydratase family protein [Deltaproteobacteria bacterium]